MLVRTRVGTHGLGRGDKDFIHAAFELFHRFCNELVERNGTLFLAAIEQFGAYPRWRDFDQLDALFP